MGISQTPQAIVPASLASGAGNMVLITSGSLSGASVTLSSLSAYTELYLQIQDTNNNTANGYPYLRINSNSGSNYDSIGYRWNSSTMGRYQGTDTAFYLASDSVTRTDGTNQFTIFLSNCKNPGFTRIGTISAYPRGGGGTGIVNFRGVYSVAEAVSSITFANDGGTWSAGTYRLWGA
jgi:hypothetical protein